MTNSDGGFQFDFKQPEKPVRPTVPPIPGQETAAYSTEPTAQATPALQFTENPDKLAELMRQAIFRKPKSHHFEEQNPEKSSETMNQIGG